MHTLLPLSLLLLGSTWAAPPDSPLVRIEASEQLTVAYSPSGDLVPTVRVDVTGSDRLAVVAVSLSAEASAAGAWILADVCTALQLDPKEPCRLSVALGKGGVARGDLVVTTQDLSGRVLVSRGPLGD